MYDKAEAYLGGGNADRLKWIKQISFDGHTHDYLPLHGTADQSKALSNGSMRYGWCVNNANSGYRWFRIGTMTAPKNAFDTETLFLHVCEGYGRYGVLCAYTKINSTGVGVETMRLSWLSRDSAEARSHFKLVAIKSSNGVNFELWCFTSSRYSQTAYYVIADIKVTGDLSNRWVLEIHGDSDAKNATTVGMKSVTDEDLSYANTANKATEATVLSETAWTDVPETNISPRYGKNIKYLKSGNTVYVRGSISFSASLNNPCCGTMPSDLLPDDYQDHVFTAWNLKGGVPTAYPVVLGTDGKIILMNPTSTANWFVAGRAYNFNFNYHIG